jgi:PAS domain S-box-containing protein
VRTRNRGPAPRALSGLWSIERTILSSFMAGLTVLGLLGVLSWYAATRAVDTSRRVAESQETIRLLHDFHAQMYRAFTNQRGFLLTGGEVLRERRNDAVHRAGEVLGALERAGARALPSSDLTRLRGLVAERAAHFAQVDRIESGQGRQRAIEAFALVDPEATVSAVIGSALAEEGRRLAERESAERATLRSMYAAFAGIGLALVLGMALIFRRVRGELQRRECSETLLREASERLERALGASRMALWESDLRTDCICFDRRLDDPTGEMRLPTCLPAREARELIFPGERDHVGEAVAQAVSGAHDEWSAEHRMRGPRGEWLWVLSRGRVTERDAGDGRALRISGTSVDITERKLAEERLQALSEALEQRVDERTAQVRALLEELRRLNAGLERRVAERTAELDAANRELGAFSYSVSHDLHAPIRAINGFARMLEESDGERLSAEGRRLLEVILANSLRMGRLVDDLLRLSRAGRDALKVEELDVTAMASRVADELRASYPRARIHIAAVPPARADRALLERVLVNLLGNALKYSALRPDPEVEFGAVPINGGVAYFVRDNGVGFEPQFAARLFEPFQRLHGAEFEGSGIGLAIVRRIVERHGGRIRAEGAPGEGATFYFMLAPSAKA